LKDSNQKEK